MLEVNFDSRRKEFSGTRGRGTEVTQWEPGTNFNCTKDTIKPISIHDSVPSELTTSSFLVPPQEIVVVSRATCSVSVPSIELPHILPSFVIFLHTYKYVRNYRAGMTWQYAVASLRPICSPPMSNSTVYREEVFQLLPTVLQGQRLPLSSSSHCYCSVWHPVCDRLVRRQAQQR